ncbi:M23 family metallopeptidase [Paenibacillus sp. TRM 82003]|uniref:murein hydrolase activator EnvC family protein n=1 Tax=Kineococcus sp. TRM81007 TaxID=2925831 RepID=UPI001F56CBAC|nr:M23 family metallopeptidase [Kineococcus sp. TRM81007]MCI2240240.1 M23 family metallopeptidase [Kineococcus sp. TRM81007]MCI3927582.1 M23 family metallopeptidase [Paenibacillus sp. TRM 82003]
MPSSAAPLTALSTALLAAALVTTPAVPAVPEAAAAPAAPEPAGPAPGAGWAGWAWPLHPRPAVLRGYDEVGRYAPGHRGLDLTASVGQPVLAPQDGVVVFAGPVAGRGVVVLEHAGGLRSTYEPVTASAAVGARTSRGEPFAALAEGAHCGKRACLHLGVRRGEDYLDPLAFLTPAAAPVLLPLGRPA